MQHEVRSNAIPAYALVAIYPLTMLIPPMLGSLLNTGSDAPQLQHFIVTAGVLALMRWTVTQRFTNAVAGWLYT